MRLIILFLFLSVAVNAQTIKRYRCITTTGTVEFTTLAAAKNYRANAVNHVTGIDSVFKSIAPVAIPEERPIRQRMIDSLWTAIDSLRNAIK